MRKPHGVEKAFWSQRQRAELSGVGVVWTEDPAGVGEDVKDTAQGLMCKQGRQRMGYPQCGREWVPTVWEGMGTHSVGEDGYSQWVWVSAQSTVLFQVGTAQPAEWRSCHTGAIPS